jgi:group I intron endonuclease
MDMNACGVYALIIQTKNDKKIYIGSTFESFKSRLRRHLNMLKLGKHTNPYLQHLFNKYGIPEFRVIRICKSSEEAISFEQSLIDWIKPSQLINLGPAIPSPRLGAIVTKETRMKISRSLIGRPGRPHTLETRAKMSSIRKGIAPPQKTREAQIKALTGKKLSPEHRKKISEKNKQPEIFAKIIATRKGKPLNEEHKIKISQGNKGKIKSPETCAKLSKALTGKKLPSETRKKISIAHIGRFASQETKVKMSNARKAFCAKRKLEAKKEI